MLAATVVITATATVTVTGTAGITATATAMTATTTTLGTSRTLIGLMDSVAAKSEGAHCGMHGKFVVDGIETPIEPEYSRPQRKGPVGNAGPVQIQGIIQRAAPMTDWTDEDALRLDIAMALSKIKTKPRGDRDATYRRMVAEQIVAHLKRSNWQFVKGPPAPHQG